MSICGSASEHAAAMFQWTRSPLVLPRNKTTHNERHQLHIYMKRSFIQFHARTLRRIAPLHVIHAHSARSKLGSHHTASSNHFMQYANRERVNLSWRDSLDRLSVSEYPHQCNVSRTKHRRRHSAKPNESFCIACRSSLAESN